MDGKVSAAKPKKIAFSLKDELKKKVKASKERVRKKYESSAVEWDINNKDRSIRGKPFVYKTNNGTEVTMEQKIEEGVGGVVWTATIQFSKYLEKRNKNKNPSFAGIRILELGCGTGMVGIIAASLGADVTLTDLPKIYLRAAKNIERNKKAIEEAGGKARACEFTWGDRKAVLVAKDAPPFDIILASEVIYTKESGELFLDAMQHIFSDPKITHKKTELILAGDLRGRVGRALLLKEAVKLFDVHEIKREEMDESWICDNVEMHSIYAKK
mmetsp:Transcript_17227/g.25848  ORF Transcript_17227/g.25848 Transcript_17227/m.25848 type:complete len:271 (-) Transcript_17227:117-929(-)|eukprot:CAMPEP_0167762452 /NCGR_PEP_ID=MMETSP0110_2-20121227/12775_1 /TAXON_ID=629695 /ORGANISM="Gymnochlora sp., Strain CCMP2014" /LENGTH=270 /DNA_ID=CAMNT_0007649327 /DNA_START=81 /DNA_END=893 /DNA_ORIENTATION=+